MHVCVCLCVCMCVCVCAETKRSETNMSKLDDILAEVSELVQGAYKLKASLFSSIQVKDWKFYSEPERQLLKRYMYMYMHVHVMYTHVGWWDVKL